MISKKKEIYKYYYESLRKIKEVKFSKILPYSNPVNWFVVIHVKRKKKLMTFLKRKGIETRDFFYPMNQQKCFINDKNVLNTADRFDESKKLYKTGLCMPSSINLKKKQLSLIIKNILAFYENRY